MEKSKPKPFYVIKRQGKKRKVPVYYYRVLDDDWNLIGEWSTGKTNRDDAVSYCTMLKISGALIQAKGKKAIPDNPPLFKDYFADWFLWPEREEPKCPYISKRLKKKKSYARNTAYIQRGNLTKYILPQFGERHKASITKAEVEEWLYNLPDDFDIRPRTANNIFDTLRKMMTEAYRLEHIPKTPCKDIEHLGTDPIPRDILRLPEVDALFYRLKREEIWPEPMAYIGTLLAAVTGMRTGEIRALRPSQIKEDYIVIDAAIDNTSGELKKPKNNRDRKAPLPNRLRSHLLEMAGDSEGFIFSEDGGDHPVGNRFFYDHFKYALDKIGIDDVKRKERNLVFHGWRIFFNTMMQVSNISEAKVKAIIGHLDESMTEHYTNVPVEEYKTEEVRTIPELQERILRMAA